MVRSSLHNGYILLVSILVIGVIATATATSLLLLGWAADQNGLVVTQTAQAYEYASTCAERALLALRENPFYAGDETVTFDLGSCTILEAEGTGSEDRVICTEGRSGDSVRRLEICIDTLYPAVAITSWQEVASFTYCL